MWKYQTDDIANISLHDHLIDDIILQGNDILLMFTNGFDVGSMHSLNDTGTSKLTGKSQILLTNAKYCSNVSHVLNSDVHKTESTLIGNQFRGFEVLDFNVEGSRFTLHGNLHGKINTSVSHMDLSFFCGKIACCWDCYESDSWFVDFPATDSTTH